MLELIGNHPKFTKALEHAKTVSVSKTPVLLVGESGSGKRTMAQYVHENSNRNESNFHVVDCSQTAKQVENEILGYRDEITGRFHKGVIEKANGGTVVFANIEGLEENFQKRLYTILQELGDYELDVRVLATTTKNLSKYVGAGRFYRALFTYFSGTQITLNPLREREGDIEAIAKHFANVEAQKHQLQNVNWSSEALQKLNTYYWTHNLVELKTIIESAVANAQDGMIDVNCIELGEKKADKMAMDHDEDGIRLMSLKDAERLLIKKALIHTSENRTQAAKILGVSIRTLRNKINEYRGDGNSYFVNLR